MGSRGSEESVGTRGSEKTGVCEQDVGERGDMGASTSASSVGSAAAALASASLPVKWRSFPNHFATFFKYLFLELVIPLKLADLGRL